MPLHEDGGESGPLLGQLWKAAQEIALQILTHERRRTGGRQGFHKGGERLQRHKRMVINRPGCDGDVVPEDTVYFSHTVWARPFRAGATDGSLELAATPQNVPDIFGLFLVGI